MSGETFGLTGIDLDENTKPKIRLEKVQEEQQDVQQQKKQQQAGLRNRVLSQDSLNRKKDIQKDFQEKLPKLNLNKSNFKIRSQSTQQLPPRNTAILEQISKTQGSVQVSNPGGTFPRFREKGVPQSAKNILDIYKQKIQSEYDQLYNSKDYTQISKQLKGFEKKQVMQEQIDRQQTFLQREMNFYNQIGYQQKLKEKYLKKLQDQILQLDRAEEQPPELGVYQEKFQQWKELCEKSEDLANWQESLVFMSQARKEEVIFQRKKCQKLRLDLESLGGELSLRKKFLSQFYSEESVARLQEKIEKLKGDLGKMSEKNVPVRMKNQVESQLEDYENQQAMQEIFRHEEEMRREREEEKRRLKMEEFRAARAEQEQKNKEINKEQKRVERQLTREQEKFEELRKVTQVNNVGNLLQHKQYLQQGKEELSNFQKHFQEQIQQDKQEIAQLQEKRKKLIYEQKEGQSDDSILAKIDTIEKEILLETEQQKEIAKQINRKQMCLDQMCLSVSRILFQINSKNHAKNKSVDVQRDDLADKMNFCSLILERINGILSKNEINLKVESVNTDFNNDSPPRYLGISQVKTTDREQTLRKNSSEQVSLRNDDSQNVSELRNFIKSQDEKRN